MLINCPKCGFSQPKDQYCASCGVDMIAYRPPQKSFAQKVTGSTIFQIAVLAVIVVGVFWFVDYQHRREIRDRIADIQNAGNTVVEKRRATASNGDLASAQTEAPKPAARDTDAPAMAAQSAAQQVSQPPPSQAAPAETAPAGGETRSLAAEGNAAPAAASSSVRVLFAEVQRPLLAELMAEAKDTTSSGPFRTGVVSAFDKKLSDKQGEWSTVDSAAPKNVTGESGAIFYNGLRDEASGQFIGFTVEVANVAAGDNGSSYQVTIWRGLRDASEQIEELQVPVPETFTIPKGGAAFISGALPRRQLGPGEAELYRSVRVLNVLTRESFRAGASEFVIFIQPK